MWGLVRMDDYAHVHRNFRMISRSTAPMKEVDKHSHNDSCLYLRLISSGVAISSMSKMSYGLHGFGDAL